MKRTCVTSTAPSNRSETRGMLLSAGVGLLLLTLAAGTARAQTQLSETTWGGFGSDVAEGVVTAPDGSSYVVGITDSFAVDQFNQPSARIFLVKFEPNGLLGWQRIWNGPTVTGLGRPGVALGAGGSVYVTGVTNTNGNDAVLLKFGGDGTLLWERTWGGAASDEGLAVAAAPDGSAYIAGTADNFGSGSPGLFVVKFDAAGNMVWQTKSDGAAGNAVAVGSDGSVYAAGTTPRPSGIANFDVFVQKITSGGNLVWQRTYAAGEVADPRGGMTVAPDGSICLVGALQAASAHSVDIAALIIKLSPDGDLLFDKQFDGKRGETAAGVAVAPDDGTIYVAGTTTSFGAGFQDGFVLHLAPTGRKVLDAVTWGGTSFETGAGVAVSGGTVVLAATTTTGPPYSLLAASARLSAARGTLGIPPGVFDVATGIVLDPGLGVATPNGSTTFGGNFEAALVRIAR